MASVHDRHKRERLNLPNHEYSLNDTPSPLSARTAAVEALMRLCGNANSPGVQLNAARLLLEHTETLPDDIPEWADLWAEED